MTIAAKARPGPMTAASMRTRGRSEAAPATAVTRSIRE